MFLSHRSVLPRAGYTYLRRHPRSQHSERMIPSPTGGLCSLPFPVAPATSSGRASLALRSVTSCSLSAALEFTKVPYPTDSLQVRSTSKNHTKPRTTVCTIFHRMLMVKFRVQTQFQDIFDRDQNIHRSCSILSTLLSHLVSQMQQLLKSSIIFTSSTT